MRARLLRDPGGFQHRWRFFASPAVTVAGQVLSANAIEHGILRRSAMTLGLGYVRNPVPARFERLHRVECLDPRVHFALNCGARSCPPLAAYDPERLDSQLDAAAASYLAGETAVLDGGDTVRVPRLLQWYLGDFGGRAGIVRLLRGYGVIGPGRSPRITFGTYDWTVAVDAPMGRLEARRQASGSRTVNVEPRRSPGLAAAIVPPIASTSDLLIVRPRPDPPASRDREGSAR